MRHIYGSWRPFVLRAVAMAAFREADFGLRGGCCGGMGLLELPEFLADTRIRLAGGTVWVNCGRKAK